MFKNAPRTIGKVRMDWLLPLKWGAILLFVSGMHLNHADAFSSNGGKGDCTKCHSLSKQEANGIIRALKIPGAEILRIEISPVKGLWEISVDLKGEGGLFYVDFSKKYVLQGPIVEIKSGTNKTLESLAKIKPNKKVDFSKIPLDNALIMGNILAPIKAVVFTDPDCSYCGTLHREMEKVIEQRKDIAFYIILFPLFIHKDAYWKSKSVFCRKSLKMLEDAFAHKEIPRPECDTKEIDNNIKLAQSLGITGTPTIVSADGRVHSGSISAEQLVDLLQEKQ